MSDSEVRVLDEQQSNTDPMIVDSPSEEPTAPQDAAQANPLSGDRSRSTADSESDDEYYSELLLAAKGLIPRLQATGDEEQQLQAVSEMSHILVMGNEEILKGFPLKEIAPILITLLRMEHNFDIMINACCALTHMMEVFPRSTDVVVYAIPVFLEKLQTTQSMDLIEQSLAALNILSRRHSYSILNEDGVTACLMYLDFLSIYAQRDALTVTANCCFRLSAGEFRLVQDALPILASQMKQRDRECVESVCLAFSRLVDNFKLIPARLQEIASPEMLTNLQLLLVVTPPLVSTGTFITVLKMLSVMCANCSDLALTLLKQNMAETLLYLLTGSVEVSQEEFALIPRPPQEQIEISELIAQLLPELPSHGITAVDFLLMRSSSIEIDQPLWQWKDNRGMWQVYGDVVSRIIEAARLNGNDEISLSISGRIYTIDFNSMQQVNEDTGTLRSIQNLSSIQSSSAEPAHSNNRPTSASRDARVACLRNERDMYVPLIRSLFSVLYEVYSSSEEPVVRCKCLKALLKMFYYASPELIKDVVKIQVVSGHIAVMIASSDLKIVIASLQMAEILINKLPKEFGVHFKKEGVIYQISRLADPEVPLCVRFSSSILNELQPGTSHPSANKIRPWVREQTSRLIETYFANEGDHRPATNIITRLKSAIENLATVNCAEALFDLREILMKFYVSPFEINHSGLIRSLLNFLTNIDGPIDRDQRLRIMLNVFAGCPVDANVGSIEELNSACMSALVATLNRCVSLSEQFPIKVQHDLPTSSGAGRGPTINYKYVMKRHPDCTNLKQWEGGTINIDPRASVHRIERYLIENGYGTLCHNESDSDDDTEDNLVGPRHKLQLLICDIVLPYNMTIQDAVKQFGSNETDQNETDANNETPLENPVIYYRPLTKDTSAQRHSSRKSKGSSKKNTSQSKDDDLWNCGITPPIHSPLAPFLISQLPDFVTIQDDSLEVLNFLRILNAMNLYWNALYPAVEYKPIIPSNEFLNSKIVAKANRQLQYPLVIATGNLPSWLKQIAFVCPFLLPFETRHLLFCVISFDRHRALKRLLDISPKPIFNHSRQRVTPRLDRWKVTISRSNILNEAEDIIRDGAICRPLLEMEYQDEIGTGPGPTLEFYALVSKELQKSCLDLWNSPDSSDLEYVNNPAGLFPNPLPRDAEVGKITEAKNKFTFIGKFMAKSVKDFRILDLPFSTTFYRWLLGHQHCLTLADLQHVAPELYITLRKMHMIIIKRDAILSDLSLTPEQKKKEVEKLEFDGCPINDLGIDFVLPGHHVELLKSGRSIDLTIHNLHLYVKLVTHWTLIEGVSLQMKSLKEGIESVFRLANLRIFQPAELEFVFCGSRDAIVNWDVKTLMECCKPDHGYTCDSRAIRFLFEILSSYGREEQRMFLQFLTGSPRLPVGGFKSLSPPFTVVRKTIESNMDPDDFFPTVMTCVNYLKLPDYTNIEVMRVKLHLAASEGQHSFPLS